jgi:Flp pilus assembly pilin Flp
MIRKITDQIIRLRVLWDIHGQDLIEYALMAGFVAVTAAALSPNIAASVNGIIYQVKSVLTRANSGPRYTG